ncbi:alpha/beta hydrolase family protein [Legionella brunensis]|uniref:Dipeptidyl aminopeptidase/acylaminoacyl peptidase n=1 Tax=Legionella brunensis TaxID=29422 RepID=A0A0W0SDT4_9GAMM|nr:alpha/beta fold hydrolase [Legionella brunensis]KTC81615.1 dipeptidyl aminopeptidase/acylaminoacyl peptidase [Legionella brunensis]
MTGNYYDVYQKNPVFSEEFFGQFLRTLGKSYVQCADIGECYVTLAKIEDQNFNSWYDAWYELAMYLTSLAENSWQMGNLQTAGLTYLRATEYYRTSEFFLRANVDDPRILPCFDQVRFCFERALQALHPDVKKVAIPYDNHVLGGYLFYSPKKAKATLLLPGGYDSTVEESYTLVPAALGHNYNILIFDAPGQGQVLRRQKLYMRPDFEHVLTQVLDWVEQVPELSNNKYVLIGRSFGGYLAPRGACGESRLDGLICDPGQMDIAGSVNKLLPPPILALFQQEDATAVNSFFYDLFLKNKMKEFYFKSRMNTHGVTTPFDYIKEMTRYTFIDRVSEITCPTLVCDNPSDKISNRGNTLYEALLCEKTYIAFSDNRGAGMHCEADANGQFQRVIFDWLDQHFACK